MNKKNVIVLRENTPVVCVVPSKLFNKRQVNFVGSFPVWQQVITMLNEKTRCVCTYVRGRKRERLWYE